MHMLPTTSQFPREVGIGVNASIVHIDASYYVGVLTTDFCNLRIDLLFFAHSHHRDPIHNVTYGTVMHIITTYSSHFPEQQRLNFADIIIR